MDVSSESTRTVGWPALRETPAGPDLARMVTSRRLESLSPAELVDVAAAAKRLSTYAEALGLEAGNRLRRSIEGDVRRGDDIGAEEAAADAQREASVELAAALAETKHRTACRLHLVRRLKAELNRRRLDVAEERLRFWRKWFGDDERPPAEDAVDYWGSLAPADRAEALEMIA